jgi:hypothetical protein
VQWHNGAVARAIGMVAGVLRYCWQDDILGGPSERLRANSTRCGDVSSL